MHIKTDHRSHMHKPTLYGSNKIVIRAYPN